MVLKFSRIPGNLEKKIIICLKFVYINFEESLLLFIGEKTCLIKDHNSDLYFLIENGCPQMYG